MNASQLIYLLFIVELILSGFWYTSSAATELFLWVMVVLGCRAVLMNRSCQVYALSKWMLIYLAWLLIVAFTSTIPQTSMMTMATLANLPVIYLVASNTPSFAEIWKYLRVVLFVMGVGLAIWAIWQVFNHVGAGHAVGPLVDRNLFAALINVLWFPATFLFLSNQSKSHRYLPFLLGAGLFFMSTALFATASRGGIATWLLLLPVLLWAAYRNTQSRRLVVIIPLIAISAYFCSELILHSSIANRSFNLAEDASTNLRLLLWQSSIKMTLSHPFIGTGWGTFMNYYPAYRSPFENGSAGFSAHNDYLQFSAEGGVPALLLLLGLLLGLLFQLKRSLQRVDNLAGLESTALLLGVLALFIHAGVNFIFYGAFMNVLAGLYLVRAVQLTDTKRTIKFFSLASNLNVNLDGISQPIKRVVLSSGILLITLALGPNLAAELINKESNISIANLNSAKVNAYKIAKIITKIDPHEPIAQEIILRTAELALADSTFINTSGEAFQRELLKDTLDRFESLRIQRAYDPNIGVREAEILVANQRIFDGVSDGKGKISNDAYAKAHQVLSNNLKVDPYHAGSFISLARLKAKEGHRTEAINTLKRAHDQVFGSYNQHLIAIETLRQQASPSIVDELEALEKRVRLVDSDLEADKELTISASFNKNIDRDLARIARQIEP